MPYYYYWKKGAWNCLWKLSASSQQQEDYYSPGRLFLLSKWKKLHSCRFSVTTLKKVETWNWETNRAMSQTVTTWFPKFSPWLFWPTELSVKPFFLENFSPNALILLGSLNHHIDNIILLFCKNEITTRQEVLKYKKSALALQIMSS